MWCDQAKWVGTPNTVLKITAKQGRYFLFLIVFATFQLFVSLEPLAQSKGPFILHRNCVVLLHSTLLKKNCYVTALRWCMQVKFISNKLELQQCCSDLKQKVIGSGDLWQKVNICQHRNTIAGKYERTFLPTRKCLKTKIIFKLQIHFAWWHHI